MSSASPVPKGLPPLGDLPWEARACAPAAALAALVHPAPSPRAGRTAAPSDLPSSSCRLSPVSHGNTIALFFRSLLPNYTMEVCEHVLASLCHVGSGRAADTRNLPRRPGQACLKRSRPPQPLAQAWLLDLALGPGLVFGFEASSSQQGPGGAGVGALGLRTQDSPSSDES